MDMPTGQCLCASVRFSLEAAPLFFYRCHCSLCRRQTGTGYNCATIVTAAHFHWLAGQADISTWQKPSGYRNDFCKQCGTTVPNLLRGLPYVWVPLGLLDPQTHSMTCIGDYCLNDAMDWDTLRSHTCLEGAPASVESLIAALGVSPL